MRKFLRAVVLLPFLVATVLHAQTDDERELRQLKEERWPRAYREGDVALLDSILAKEFRRIDDKAKGCSFAGSGGSAWLAVSLSPQSAKSSRQRNDRRSTKNRPNYALVR